MMCGKYDLTRGDLDAFAARSHARAAAAVEAGRFDEQIVAVEGFDREGNPVTHLLDEGVRKACYAGLRSIGPFVAPQLAKIVALRNQVRAPSAFHACVAC